MEVTSDNSCRIWGKSKGIKAKKFNLEGQQRKGKVWEVKESLECV